MEHLPRRLALITLALVVTLTFGTVGMRAGNRLLVFQRAEETLRWKVR